MKKPKKMFNSFGGTGCSYPPEEHWELAGGLHGGADGGAQYRKSLSSGEKSMVCLGLGP